jgi:hypothetical protein
MDDFIEHDGETNDEQFRQHRRALAKTARAQGISVEAAQEFLEIFGQDIETQQKLDMWYSANEIDHSVEGAGVEVRPSFRMHLDQHALLRRVWPATATATACPYQNAQVPLLTRPPGSTNWSVPSAGARRLSPNGGSCAAQAVSPHRPRRDGEGERLPGTYFRSTGGHSKIHVRSGSTICLRRPLFPRCLRLPGQGTILHRHYQWHHRCA